MTIDDRQIDVLYISPAAFRCAPQVGVPCVMPWSSMAAYLSRPSIGDEKGCAGGYALGRYTDDARRKANLLAIEAVALDLDESCVDDVAAALARYTAIVHETFSSIDEAPRCRAVILLAGSVDAATYEAVHGIMRAKLRAAGLPPDEGAKDPCRLSYSPVRRQGAGYRFRAVQGEPLDARGVIAAQPPEAPRPASAPLPRPDHRDVYVRGALTRAAQSIAAAAPGSRHFQLCKEAFGLARLGLGESEIAAVLLPAFVAAAGEPRKREGIRAIIDAVRARGAA